jgi:hypothetical protein
MSANAQCIRGEMQQHMTQFKSVQLFRKFRNIIKTHLRGEKHEKTFKHTHTMQNMFKKESSQ